MTTLLNALGNIATIPRFFVWRLTNWNGYKFDDKTPWNGAQKFDAKAACLAGTLHTYDSAMQLLQACRAVQPADVRYSLGWYVMPDVGYWFLDIDGGTDTAEARHAWAALGPAGVFFEYSSSGNGLHFVGRGALPPHATRPVPGVVELYSRERGICFGLSGEAYGCADTTALPPAEWIQAQTHAPATNGTYTRMPAWDGPEDDDELIRRMLARREAANLLLGRPTLVQLWDGSSPSAGTSEADAALASHLAWWTGCDQERMIRLMWRSGLVRDKWTEHRTYLAITTGSACAELLARPSPSCYVQQPVKLPALPVLAAVVTLETPDAEPHRGVPAAMDVITKVGNADELKTAASRITAMGPWDAPDVETLAQRLRRKSQELGAAWPIALCRRLIDGTAPDADGGTGAPDWLEDWAFISTQNKYCHIAGDFDLIGRDALHVALYNKPELPIKASGDKEDASKMLNMWGVQVVSDIGYSPREGLTFRDGGRVLLNKFCNSMPEPKEGGDTEAIRTYTQHLWNICDHNQQNYDYLLRWMAHVVQRPGDLIRWAVLLIGKHGTGKTAMAAPLMAAIGPRNTQIGSSRAVNNGGGFMDWVASSHMLGVISDFSVTGVDKYETRDAIKPVISDNIVSITRKGKTDVIYKNYASYIFSTNKREPIPLEETERRYFVLATTWLDTLVMERPAEAKQYFKRLTQAIDALTPGQWRAWFQSIPVGELQQIAPITDARIAIVGNSVSEPLQALRECVDGFDVVTTNKLTDALRGIDGAPNRKALSRAMNELGFDYYDKQRMTLHGTKVGIYVRSAKISISSVDWQQLRAMAEEFNRVKDAGLFVPARGGQ